LENLQMLSKVALQAQYTNRQSHYQPRSAKR
jgi:hypothetical protein